MKRPTSEFHLLPSSWRGRDAKQLQGAYERAFARAEELFIVSAFLTEWPESLRLSRRCDSFYLVVGADYGTTRVAALNAALDWVPERFSKNILAFNLRGVSFHPKAVLWREHDGSCYFLIGSSNLTRAAFKSNVEANVVLPLSVSEYRQALTWAEEIKKHSVLVDAAWLRKYKEAPARRRGKRAGADNRTSEEPVYDLSLDVKGVREEREFERQLEVRRQRRKVFDEAARPALLELFRWAAGKRRWAQADGKYFYDQLLELWARPGVRMGGLQWTIHGKDSNHQALAKGLVAVIKAKPAERDSVVVKVLNQLQDAGVSTRAAVMSEFLCQLFPSEYPLLDAPVKKWRSKAGFDRRVGGTEGERYLRLARAMRAALNEAGPRRLGIADLAELDVLIWLKFPTPSRAKT